VNNILSRKKQSVWRYSLRMS